VVGGGGRLCRLLQRCLKNGGVGSVMSTHTVKSVSRDDRGGRKGGGSREGSWKGRTAGEYVESWGNGDSTCDTGAGAKTHGVGIDA